MPRRRAWVSTSGRSSGGWTVSRRAATATAANVRLAYRFQARDVNLVMGPAVKGTAIPFRVFLDGQPATGAHGADVGADGTGSAAEQRTYQLIRQSGPISERTSRSSSSPRASSSSASPSADRSRHGHGADAGDYGV